MNLMPQKKLEIICQMKLIKATLIRYIEEDFRLRVISRLKSNNKQGGKHRKKESTEHKIVIG